MTVPVEQARDFLKLVEELSTQQTKLLIRIRMLLERNLQLAMQNEKLRYEATHQQ